MAKWKTELDAWVRALEVDDIKAMRAAKKRLYSARGDDRLIEAVIELLPQETDENSCRVAYLLSDLAGREHIEMLLPLLNHADASLRSAAATALGVMDAWDIVLEHLLPLARDPSNEVRASVVSYLRYSDDPAVCPILFEALKSDVCADVRQWAAYGLLDMKCPGREDALVAALHDPDEKVRKEACMSLGYANLKGAATALRRVLREDPSAQVRSRAARALGDFGCAEELETIQRQYEQEMNTECRMELARALLALGDERPWPWMIEEARTGKDLRLSSILATHLRAMASPETVHLAREGLRELVRRDERGEFDDGAKFGSASGFAARHLKRLDERFGKEAE